jgi:hypothetical protein
VRIHAFTILAFTAALTAQTHQPSEEPQPAQGATFRIEAGVEQLPELVRRAAAFLGRNVMWTLAGTDPSQLEIEITQPLELDARTCEDVISGFLFRCNHAIVPLNEEEGIYEVISLVGPRRGEVAARAVQRTPEEVIARPNLYVCVTTNVELQHVDARIATQALRPFFSQVSSAAVGLMVGNTGSDRSLLLQGLSAQVAQAIRLLRDIDRPPPQPAQQDSELARLAATLDELAARIARLEYHVGLEKKD